MKPLRAFPSTLMLTSWPTENHKAAHRNLLQFYPPEMRRADVTQRPSIEQRPISHWHAAPIPPGPSYILCYCMYQQYNKPYGWGLDGSAGRGSTHNHLANPNSCNVQIYPGRGGGSAPPLPPPVLRLPYINSIKQSLYTVFRKKTPTHIFFHISMNDKWI